MNRSAITEQVSREMALKARVFRSALWIGLSFALIAFGLGNGVAKAQSPKPETIYRPIPLKVGSFIEDSLSEKDIPTGKGSFARDYAIELAKGDQIAIDLLSETFDTVVTLMTPNGTTVGENDDGPDGGTNSLLFMRIPQSGSYIVRVQAFGQAKGGDFTLKLTRLEAAPKN